jgi:hypothetical protein
MPGIIMGEKGDSEQIMSGIHENELTTNLEQIKESTNKLEAILENMKSSLIKSILSDSDKSDKE